MTNIFPLVFTYLIFQILNEKGTLRSLSRFHFLSHFFNSLIIDNNNDNVNNDFIIVYIEVRRPIGVSGYLEVMSNHIPVQDSRAI